MDVFLDWKQGTPDELGRLVTPLAGKDFKLGQISNRGIEVWPGGFPETFCTDHWRCRFVAQGTPTVTHAQIAELLARIGEAGLDFIKTENLCAFDGQKSYSGSGCTSLRGRVRVTVFPEVFARAPRKARLQPSPERVTAPVSLPRGARREDRRSSRAGRPGRADARRQPPSSTTARGLRSVPAALPSLSLPGVEDLGGGEPFDVQGIECRRKERGLRLDDDFPARRAEEVSAKAGSAPGFVLDLVRGAPLFPLDLCRGKNSRASLRRRRLRADPPALCRPLSRGGFSTAGRANRGEGPWRTPRHSPDRGWPARETPLPAGEARKACPRRPRRIARGLP